MLSLRVAGVAGATPPEDHPRKYPTVGSAIGQRAGHRAHQDEVEGSQAMKDKVSAPKIDALLQDLIRTSGLSLTYRFASSTKDQVQVEFAGPDAAMLVARNAELLLALEHLTARTLRLEPEEHDLINFEAGGFKAGRDRNLKRTADDAILEVRRTGKPFAFAPMSSHERRLLHLALASSGLFTQSEGEGALRHLVLHPRAPSTQ